MRVYTQGDPRWGGAESKRCEQFREQQWSLLQVESVCQDLLRLGKNIPQDLSVLALIASLTEPPSDHWYSLQATI